VSFLSKNLNKSDTNFFALDISDSSVKVLQLEKGKKIDKISSFFSLDIPSGILEGGRITKKDRLAGIICDAIKKAGPRSIKTKKVACSLPESKAFLRIINMPKMSQEEIQEAIKWEIEASIPLSVDQVYYDWQFISETKNKQNVLTVAVAKEVIDEMMETLNMAGLDVCTLELESIASARSLIPENTKENSISLIVDIGSKKTSLIITEGNIPYFTSSIPVSSVIFNDAISKNFNVNIEEAEKIKKNQGIEHSFENNSVFSSIQAELENLACEIEKSIDFYQTMTNDTKKLDRVIMCGGGSNLKGLLPYLTTRLCREIDMGNPWVNLRLGDSLPIINKETSLSFSTAIGLALKRSNYGD
jgi:type IV pilus assembly protein PilM